MSQMRHKHTIPISYISKQKGQKQKHQVPMSLKSGGRSTTGPPKKSAENKSKGLIWGEELMEEIRQLGGTKEDLEFLKDVDVDDEQEEIVTKAVKGVEVGK